MRVILPVAGILAIVFIMAMVMSLPASWPIAIAAALLAITIITYFIVGPKSISLWKTIALPLMFLLAGAIGLILFLETQTARQLLILFVAALGAVFWESARRYIWAESQYHTEQLENISLLTHLIAIWVIADFFYRLLLDPSILPQFLANNIFFVASALIVGVAAILEWRSFWSSRYPKERVWPHTMVVVLLLGEFFWVLNFLSLSPDVKAFLLAALYYSLIMIGRAHLDSRLSRAVVRRYLYFIVIIVTLALVTARWIV